MYVLGSKAGSAFLAIDVRRGRREGTQVNVCTVALSSLHCLPPPYLSSLFLCVGLFTGTRAHVRDVLLQPAYWLSTAPIA